MPSRSPTSRRRPARALPALLALGFAALAADAALAQEIVRPRQPALVLRPAAIPEELAAAPIDSLLRFPRILYDPWTGSVRARRAFEPLGPDRPPVVGGLDVLTWSAAARIADRRRLLTDARALGLGRRGDRPPEGLIPEMENPLRIPEPLAKVFGEGSEFDVQGKLHLGAVGSRNRQDPDLRSELLRQTIGAFDLDLDQVLDLRVLGTVGTKLDVAVDFNSGRELDSKQLITARYTGTEDEILKTVEVGDVQVMLPPSRFLGGGSARGTFGSQAVAQLGPVDLRFLASRKEGQTTTRGLSIAPRGGGVLTEVTLDIKDTQYQDDRFFLLFHPDSLSRGRLEYPNPGTALDDPTSAPAPNSLNVWVDDGNFTNNRERASKPGTARINPTAPATRPDEIHNGFFDLLVEGEDYVVTDGIVLQLKRQLNDEEVLAVSYVTRAGLQVGSAQGDQTLDLKLIKPVNPDTLDFTWDQTLRNVYSLREPNVQLGSLELEIYRGNQDLKRTFDTIGGVPRKYSEIFGVTDANARVKVPRVLRDPFGGADYVVFPDVRPFFQPTAEDGTPIPLEVPNRRLYFNSDPRRTALDDQIYFIQATYLSRGGVTGEIELGASNVIEGSETITIGGQPLVRGEDYQIFYDFGKVVFTDPAGLAERHPDAAVDIRFEVAPLFNLAPTSLWGAAGTWDVAPGAAVNSTLLVQNQESLANRPILGAEPTRTMIGEVDGSWVRALPGMSRWLDRLPGVDPAVESRFTLRGEVAFSRPDPNTEGRVFLNDFENVEVAKRLNLFFRAWAFGAIPEQTPFGLTDAGAMQWFTFARPVEQITPGVIGADPRENVFTVRFTPAGATAPEREASWRSIQTIVSTTGEDLTRQEFVEFFVRGEAGTILLDLGTVDEDAVRFDEDGAPVGIGVLDTEEDDPNTRDNSLDVGEDTGLDAVAGDDFLEVPGDDGNDDFDQTFSGVFPANPNGTENNTTLDTEDVNLNELLDRQEDVLRWEIDLADDRYEVPGSRSGTGFRKIRLPLVAPDAAIGSPDIRNVRAIRLTYTGVDRPSEFEIVRLEIVGSSFLERGIVAADGTVLAGQNSDSLRITAVNDLENPDYRSPPGVRARGERADQVGGIGGLIVEQSLELGWTGLPPGARGSIYRPLFDRETYIDYRRMRLWVQGRRTEPAGPPPSFVVAFGLDTLNVYEYAAPLLEEEWEEHVIEFSVFTELKRQLVDSVGQGAVGEAVSPDGRYRVRIANPLAPPPTLTEVSQLTIAVENTTDRTLDGTFWIDEWRLTDPLREGDVASYVHASTTLADLGAVALTWESRGARYRNLNAVRNNFDTGTLDVSASLRLDKLVPGDWGVALPLTWDRNGRSAAPLYRVGSDVELEDGAERERQTREDARDVVTLRAFRTRESQNPFLAATLDRLEARVSWRDESFGSVDVDSDRGRWDGWLGYRHGFRRRALALPLEWVAKLPWPGSIRSSAAIQALASADLNLVPATIALSAETANEERTTVKRIGAEGTDFSADTVRALSGNASIALQPFTSMRATFAWDANRDLNFPETVISRGALGVDALRSHRLDFDWSPPVAGWLVPRYSFSSDFARNHSREAARAVDSLDLRDFSVTTNENVSLEFRAAELAAAVFGVAAESQPWWRRAFEPFRIDVRRQESASYVQEVEDPGFGFTYGFGSLADEADGKPQNLSRNETVTVSSGVQLWRGLRIRGGWRENETRRTYFEGTNGATTRTWPDVEARWPGLPPPPFLRGIVGSFTLASDFERRTEVNRANGRSLNDAERSVFSPLLGVTLNWANGMATDLRANASRSETRTIRGGVVDSRRAEDTTDLLFNLTYHVRPGTKLYIPFPSLWGVTLERPLLTAMTIAQRYREDRTALEGQPVAGAALNMKTRTTEVRPSISYEFGRVVSGFAFSYLARLDEKRDVKNTTMSLEAYLDFLF